MDSRWVQAEGRQPGRISGAIRSALGDSVSERRNMKKHIGSTIALVLGVLMIVNPKTTVTGLIITLGALAYRSAKNRKIGAKASTTARQCLELAAIALSVLAVVVVVPPYDLRHRIVTDPFPNLIIPLWVLIAYLMTASFNLSRRVGVLLGISATVVFALVLLRPDKRVLKTEEDLQYYLNTILPDSNTAPGLPQNKLQLAIHDMMEEVKELNTSATARIEAIGTVEIASLEELRDTMLVEHLRQNLNQHLQVKEFYYNSYDSLLRRYQKMMGEEAEEGRLDGTMLAAQEIDEMAYARSLGDLYEFVLAHHRAITFSQGQVYLETDEMLNEWNRLWTAIEESDSAMVVFQEKRSTIVQGMVDAADRMRKTPD